MIELWNQMPTWLDFLIRGIVILLTLIFYSVTLSRMGRNPYWALLGLLPLIVPVAVWFLAYARWPQEQLSPASRPQD